MSESSKPERENAESVFARKKVSVLGGLGFIGSNAALRLLELGADVVVVDALLDGFGGDRRNLPKSPRGCRVHVADARDPGLAELIEGSSVVVNAVGQVSHHRSMTDPITDLEANCRAQLCILETCRRLTPMPIVVYAGTRQVYGRARELPITESVQPLPVDINGVNKYAGEEFHRIYFEAYGLPTIRLRLTNTYGPRQSLRAAAQGVIPTFMKRALQGKALTVFGDGRQRRDATYVADVVEAIVAVVAADGAPGRVFNLGSNRPISIGTMAQVIARAAGVEVEFSAYPDDLRRLEIGDSWSSYDRLQVATGWKPDVDFEDGVVRTLDFYRANPEYWVDA